MPDSVEYLEAECRRQMAHIANLPPARGFDTARIRNHAMRQLDDLLDAWHLETMLTGSEVSA